MDGFTQRQMGLFLPRDYQPARPKWAPCPPDLRAKLRALRTEFAERASARAAAAKKGGMRY